MKKLIIYVLTALVMLTGCSSNEQKTAPNNQNFKYTVEKFADLQILRYRVNGFEELSLQQKELVYYLTEAALWGRDIFYDQNGKYNLCIAEVASLFTNSILAFTARFFGTPNNSPHKHGTIRSMGSYLRDALKGIFFPAAQIHRSSPLCVCCPIT